MPGDHISVLLPGDGNTLSLSWPGVQEGAQGGSKKGVLKACCFGGQIATGQEKIVSAGTSICFSFA